MKLLILIMFVPCVLFADTSFTVTIPTDNVQRVLTACKSQYPQLDGETTTKYANRVVGILLSRLTIDYETGVAVMNKYNELTSQTAIMETQKSQLETDKQKLIERIKIEKQAILNASTTSYIEIK